MKKSRKSILYLSIVILIIVIVILIGIIINLLNKNRIEDNEKIAKEQLEETTGDNAYISMSTHTSELAAKQQEIDNMQNTAGQATATADKILKNYTAYKEGKLITGTMENRGELNWNPTTSTSYTVLAGYYSGGILSTANAYSQGYKDGLSQSNVVINYHEHSSSCKCSGNVSCNSTEWSSTYQCTLYHFSCSKCSAGYNLYKFDETSFKQNLASINPCPQIKCGKDNTIIESITINGVTYK